MTHEVVPQSHEVQDLGNGELEDKRSESAAEEAVFLEPLSSIHSIILDWTAATFIDSVGAKAIKQVFPFNYFGSFPYSISTAFVTQYRFRVGR